MSAVTTKILIIVILLFLSAFFSCSETAFFSLTRAQLNRLKRSKKGYSRLVIKVLKNPRETLITTLLGNELVNVAFAVAVASLIYSLMGPVEWKIRTIISICIAVPAVLIFGEVTPKNIAVRFAPKLVPILVYPISLFSLIVAPFRILLTKFSDRIITLFGGDPMQVRSMIMEEEFRQIVDLGCKEGALEEGESELIHRIFELGNKNVSEIMTPTGKIFRLPIDLPIEKIIEEMKATQFNRVPVYKNHPDDILGALHSRDIFKLYRQRQRGHMQEAEAIVRPVHFVADTTVIEDLLSDMQKMKVHMAVVKDKKHEIVGLVTMDDIFRLLFTRRLGWKRVTGSRKHEA